MERSDSMSVATLFKDTPRDLYKAAARADGPQGKLPLTGEMLKESPSGNIFGLTINAGMGWEPEKLSQGDVLIVSTRGGLKDAAGNTLAVGLHNGHFDLDIQVGEAARTFKEAGAVPHAVYVSDPCDGRTQGTTGMFDSLPYRNDAAMVMGRLIRSLPTRKAVMGVASCDKGLPATLMALASCHDLPVIVVPGGSTLLSRQGEDLGTVQTLGVRYANDEISLEEAARLGCSACACSGGACQFLGTGGTSQVVAEALGLTLPHAALAPSGQPVWREVARKSALAAMAMIDTGLAAKDILTDEAIENAMVLHAAFGGSTNLLLHLPAIAFAAGCRRPTVHDWNRINKEVPRLVSVLPIGPVNYPTSDVFLAGGVPEVMLHLRRLGLLHEKVRTVTGSTLGEVLDWWEAYEGRQAARQHLQAAEGIDPAEVIFSPERARKRGIGSTVAFPVGNIAPEGSVVKATAIDPGVIDEDKVFRHKGKARVFTSEKAAIRALKEEHSVAAGDIMVVMGGGPLGTGMEETYQLTSALKQLPFGKHVSLITDARFSGVSTGACFGHVGPEALAGGPIGKLRDGDIIEIAVDTVKLEGTINFVGTEDQSLTYEEGAAELERRETHPGLEPDPLLPADTRLWAALQDVSGGTWQGTVYDVDKILKVLKAGKEALAGEGASTGGGKS